MFKMYSEFAKRDQDSYSFLLTLPRIHFYCCTKPYVFRRLEVCHSILTYRIFRYSANVDARDDRKNIAKYFKKQGVVYI